MPSGSRGRRSRPGADCAAPRRAAGGDCKDTCNCRPPSATAIGLGSQSKGVRIIRSRRIERRAPRRRLPPRTHPRHGSPKALGCQEGWAHEAWLLRRMIRAIRPLRNIRIPLRLRGKAGIVAGPPPLMPTASNDSILEQLEPAVDLATRAHIAVVAARLAVADPAARVVSERGANERSRSRNAPQPRDGTRSPPARRDARRSGGSGDGRARRSTRPPCS